jgi:broad specificity phosphatase PhoE
MARDPAGRYETDHEVAATFPPARGLAARVCVHEQRIEATMSVIYLVRHGQGSFGTANYDQLSPLGRTQASLVGQHFAAMGEKIDRIYSGALQRQRETATLIAAALSDDEAARPAVEIDAAFNEYDGDGILREYAASLPPAEAAAHGWPGLLHERKKFQLFLEKAARAWVQAELAAESLLPWKGFHGRIVASLEQIMKREGRGKTLVISTSGGVIGTLVAHVLGLSNHMGIELNWAVHNASLTRLIYSDTKLSLSMFNALPHLEQSDRKELITFR